MALIIICSFICTCQWHQRFLVVLFPSAKSYSLTNLSCALFFSLVSSFCSESVGSLGTFFNLETYFCFVTLFSLSLDIPKYRSIVKCFSPEHQQIQDLWPCVWLNTCLDQLNPLLLLLQVQSAMVKSFRLWITWWSGLTTLRHSQEV